MDRWVDGKRGEGEEKKSEERGQSGEGGRDREIYGGAGKRSS